MTRNASIIHILDALGSARIPIENAYLTAQEYKILIYTSHGFSAKSIAYAMNISYRTVETHIGNIKCKLSCKYKTELVQKCLDYNMNQKILDLL